MATLVCFHAHPDDEAITTGGVIAKYAALGHRVVITFATGGEHGEVPDDLIAGETLVDRRRAESECSAGALGAAAVRWLGYRDSGMTGWDQNDHPEAFARAPVEAPAQALAAILREEEAAVLTTYDWHGNYGHPDHVQVHRVGHRAAELAATPVVYEATSNRDLIRTMLVTAREAGMTADDFDPDGPADDGNPFGTPDADITTAVDVTDYLDRKRASLRCHRSQVGDTSLFLTMPDSMFRVVMGTEWFIRVDSKPPTRESALGGLE